MLCAVLNKNKAEHNHVDISYCYPAKNHTTRRQITAWTSNNSKCKPKNNNKSQPKKYSTQSWEAGLVAILLSTLGLEIRTWKWMNQNHAETPERIPPQKNPVARSWVVLWCMTDEPFGKAKTMFDRVSGKGPHTCAFDNSHYRDELLCRRRNRLLYSWCK